MPKHGDVRDDGYIFWGYNKKSARGEDWRSPEVFYRCKLRITVEKEAVRQKRKLFLNYAKTARGCASCGEKHPAALSFHHEHDKAFNLGDATHYKWKTILKELKKCVVLCHNCHAKHHADNEDHKFISSL